MTDSDKTKKIMETGVDSSLSATDVLIAAAEFMADRNRAYRIVILGLEEDEDEAYVRFTNARSLAEEVGIITICGKDSTRLDLVNEEDE